MASSGDLTIEQVVALAQQVGEERDYYKSEMERLQKELAEKPARKSRSKKAADGTEKEPRQPNPYNQFMKEEMSRIKTANPGLAHKDAFKQAAAAWPAYKTAHPELFPEGAAPKRKPAAPKPAGAKSAAPKKAAGKVAGKTAAKTAAPKKAAGKKAAAPKEEADKAPKAPSAYNQFMKVEVERLKQTRPDITDHKERFKVAAAGWAASPQNPKNQKA